MSFFRKAGSDSSSSESESEEELLSDASDGEQKTTLPVKKSRFARDSGDDSSSDDSDDDEDGKSDGDADADAAVPARGSRFMRGAESSDSDDDEDTGKRVARSAKSKRAEELEQANKRVENAAKIDDWTTVNSEFDKMTRLVASSPGNILAVVSIPPLYLRLISTLENTIKSQSGKSKKMNATQSRGLNGMKQKMKKAQREHEEVLEKYQADPEKYERDFEGVPVQAPQPRRRTAAAAQEDGQEGVDDFTTVGKGGKALNITADNVLKTLQQVLEARGKKATDRQEQIKILEKLLSVAATPYAKIRVLLALISSLYDYNQSSHNYLPIDQWSAARTRLNELLELLASEPNYIIAEETEDYDELEERSPPKDDKDQTTGPLKVRGSILSLVERLDDEFTRSLKDIDPHAIEYVDRLKDESKLYQSLAQCQAYFEAKDLVDSLDRTILRRLDHVYGKPDAVIDFLENSLPRLESSIWSSPPPSTPGSGNLVRALCVYLYQTRVDARLRSRAVLCHVFHHALHNDFFRARDQLLMSHVHYSVANMDVDTQILYNRTISQLGLSAFRNGLVEETEAMLRDLYANPTLVRERLAQGMQRRNGPDYAVSPEQEKLEKARQVPFHQHINLELLECAYLVSSMLVEIPQIALEEYDPERKRDVKSRMFRRQLDTLDKQIFQGPPENKREHVVQAAKALQAGEWRQCIELIESIRVWSLMPGEREIKAMLSQRIQEEAMRTYLFSHATFYSTISLSYLASTFELSLTTVTSIVANMIWNEQIAGSLSLNTETLVLHRETRSALQQMALSLADKVNQALGENERTANNKFGDADGQGRDNRGDRQQGDGQRRGGERRPMRGGSGGRGGGRGRGSNNFSSGIGRAIRA